MPDLQDHISKRHNTMKRTLAATAAAARGSSIELLPEGSADAALLPKVRPFGFLAGGGLCIAGGREVRDAEEDGCPSTSASLLPKQPIRSTTVQSRTADRCVGFFSISTRETPRLLSTQIRGV